MREETIRAIQYKGGVMSKSFSRSMRHTGLISALVMAPCLAINAGVVSAETINGQLAAAPNVPPPIIRTQPANVVVHLEASEWVGPLSDDNNYELWGFNKTVPGPMIRVMLGDTVEIHLKNDKNSKESHNIDFHAITGPGGGASLLNSEPGQETAGRFKMIIPGIFFYHCATASPSIPEHMRMACTARSSLSQWVGLSLSTKNSRSCKASFTLKKAPRAKPWSFSYENGLDELS